MKFKTLHSISILIVFYLCIYSSSWGALVMKDDGSALNLSFFDAQQTIRVKTSSGESTIKLGNIEWIAGSDKKRIRLSKKNELVIGEIQKEEIKMKKGEEDVLIFPEHIIFFYNIDVDLEKVGSLKIEEYEKKGVGKLITTTSYDRTDQNKMFKVVLLPENWGGNIKFSNPIYANKLSTRSDLEITFDIQGDSTLISEEINKKGGMVLYYEFKEKGKGSGALSQSLRLYSWKDSKYIYNNITKTISLTYNSPFYVGLGDEYYGNGNMYLFIKKGEDEILGNGNLSIVQTISNVLFLPITVEK